MTTQNNNNISFTRFQNKLNELRACSAVAKCEKIRHRLKNSISLHNKPINKIDKTSELVSEKKSEEKSNVLSIEIPNYIIKVKNDQTLKNENKSDKAEVPLIKKKRNNQKTKIKKVIINIENQKSEIFPEKNISSEQKKKIIDLRKDLLFFPKTYDLDYSLNKSFVSFQDLHRQNPNMYPILNYISNKEKQEEEEKKKREESMSALEKYLRDLKRNSIPLINANNKPIPYREFNQIIKELKHNSSQKLKYDKLMNIDILLKNEQSYYDYFKNIKKMPPIKILPSINKKNKALNSLNRNQQEKQIRNYFVSNNLEAQTSLCHRFSLYKFDLIQEEVHPNSREGATLSVIRNKAFLIGGRGASFRNHLCYLNIEKKKWKFLKVNKNINEEQQFLNVGKTNHTTTLYKHVLIIFGGESEYNSNLKMRECHSEIQLLDLREMSLSSFFCRGETPEARKNHIAVLIGHQILIHGGLNSFSKYLKDSHILDLEKKTWINCESTLELPYLAHHTGAAVFESEKQIRGFFYKKLDGKNNQKNYIKEEGIYIFGGKTPQNKSTNTMIIIKLGSIPLKTITPEISGIPPLARYNHGMKYCKYLNSIIIFGGRNDELNIVLNDVYMMNVEYFYWLKIAINENLTYEARFSFSYDIHNNKILLFGGINFDGYVNNDVFVIDLNENAKRKREIEFFDSMNNKKNKNNDIFKEIKINTIKESFQPIPDI